MRKKIFFIIVLFLAQTVFAREQVIAKHGMAVSEQRLASQVGVNILKSGGNAIDAAVAMGYALAVVNPCCGNIGGGGFMTIHLANKKNLFINFRERAPLAATKNMYLDAEGNPIPARSQIGYLSVAVPGTVKGLNSVLEQYGTMSREKVIAPAIALAQNGFRLTAGDVDLLQRHADIFKTQPNVAAIFLRKNGEPLQVGDRLIQKDLAATLKLIAKQGSKVFYEGIIAQKIVEASQQHGGILTMQDFADYTIQEVTPLFCTYHDYTIETAPPPSSGGVTLCEILNIVETYPLKRFGFHSAKSTHYLVEAMRYAFYDRNNQLGDPDFVKNPVSQLISKDYADQIRQRILDVEATPSVELGADSKTKEHVNTTHYSVYDKWGNAVSVTYTLNGFYGAKVIAGDTGFFLNDEMDDFTAKAGKANKFGLVQGDQNTIAPGKRPLSSMTPTIILKNNKVVMVVGSPGGPRIITATLETVLNYFIYDMNIQQAVDAPRFHHQWLPDVVYSESHAFSPKVEDQLVKMKYRIIPSKPWGAVEAIAIDPKNKILYGGSDKRRLAGGAIGY